MSITFREAGPSGAPLSGEAGPSGAQAAPFAITFRHHNSSPTPSSSREAPPAASRATDRSGEAGPSGVHSAPSPTTPGQWKFGLWFTKANGEKVFLPLTQQKLPSDVEPETWNRATESIAERIRQTHPTAYNITVDLSTVCVHFTKPGDSGDIPHIQSLEEDFSGIESLEKVIHSSRKLFAQTVWHQSWPLSHNRSQIAPSSTLPAELFPQTHAQFMQGTWAAKSCQTHVEKMHGYLEWMYRDERMYRDPSQLTHKLEHINWVIQTFAHTLKEKKNALACDSSLSIKQKKQKQKALEQFLHDLDSMNYFQLYWAIAGHPYPYSEKGPLSPKRRAEVERTLSHALWQVLSQEGPFKQSPKDIRKIVHETLGLLFHSWPEYLKHCETAHLPPQGARIEEFLLDQITQEYNPKDLSSLDPQKFEVIFPEIQEVLNKLQRNIQEVRAERERNQRTPSPLLPNRAPHSLQDPPSSDSD